ncbi:MAG: protein kinase [Candidatus Eisenbacteria bacterium]|nr:protein kinase [Candidatus Eisenbacteria bacterium]
MIGTTVSHYTIIEKLGQGGMGIVYKARDLELERFVALKFLPAYMTDEEDQRQRFIREAKAVSSLDHPNVCTIYEISRTPEGQLFIVMAYYEGMTLKALLLRGRLSLDRVLGYSVQMARGLARTHDAEVTHRDLKPANVIITRHDEVKILDFGLAKLANSTGLTRTGSTMGTISYMSPEQARGDSVDLRTDIWSLGVVMYEMLTGGRPFHADVDQAVIYAILNTRERSLTEIVPGVPESLARIVHRALAKDPNKRFASMHDLLAGLDPLQSGTSSESSITRTSARIPARKSNRRWIATALVGGIVSLLGLFLILERPFSRGVHDTAVAVRDVPRETVGDGRKPAEAEAVAPEEARRDGDSKNPARAPAGPLDAGPMANQQLAPEAATPGPHPEASATPGPAGDAERARIGMQQAKTALERAAAGEQVAEIVDISAAVQAESVAGLALAAGDFGKANARFSEAAKLYQAAEGAVKRRLEQAQGGALAQRQSVQGMRSGMPSDMTAFPSYREGWAAEQAGDSALAAGLFVAALRSYQSARQRYGAAQDARQKEVGGIEELVGRYRAAIEAEDLRALGALHMNFTDEIRDGWSSFFHDVGSVRVQLAIDSVRFEPARAVTHVTAHISYSGAGGRNTHPWDMIMSERNGHWLIAEVKTKP